MQQLNNLQRQETAKWLLSISGATIVGGVGSYFVPGVSERVGLLGVIASIIASATCYLAAMYFGRKVKNAS